ncbi:phage tail-like protein [Plasticicumulans lactativorans]|uniref:Phage tail-like protein n=1 Tax=Plasticicumulans lactativorans TaxID=1133106 RepID=A0A4R2LMF8_9GAMM|nr:phage tail protein [Plasticicumulans lactativorans]TCO80635.1 phage tail-like protein [Plasticicumulans lactativorans]
MATFRDNPYGAFNFLVALGTGAEETVVGGFSDVSGLGFEVSYSEYRNGNEKFNTVRKVPNTHKVDDVTLKRGLIGSTDLFEWLKTVRDGTPEVRQVSITLLDEARQPVATWTLRNAQPKKWTGPTLAAKGGGEVAMEELSLVHEGLEYK